MLVVEIKSMFCPDFEFDEWKPDDDDVYLLVEMEVGPVGEPGADLFQVVVATPSGLLRCGAAGEVLSERGLIVLSKFSWGSVRARLQAIVQSCACRDWVDASAYLQRYFYWEYEDMQRSGVRKLELRGTKVSHPSPSIWEPDQNVALDFLDLEIGFAGELDVRNFQVTIATPRGLQHLNIGEDEVIADRGVIVVRRFSKPIVQRALKEIVEGHKCDGWDDACDYLQRYFARSERKQQLTQ